MATTDTRSGFRLPWSSDRNHDTTEADEAAAAAGETVAEAAPEAPEAWPASDVKGAATAATDALTDDAGAIASPTTETPAPVAEEPAMLDLQPSPAQPMAAPRKPTKLMADLSAAIRSTAEAARDQALVQLDADAARVVETIRAGSKEGEAALRSHSDEDLAAIKEWSRAEIARIKEEAERRIDARKLGLDEELAEHAAAIEQRVGVVEGTVATYRTEMDAYAERLGREEDPARLATLAESMPEPPALEGWSDLSDLAFTAEPVLAAEAPVVEPPHVAEPELEPAPDPVPAADVAVEAGVEPVVEAQAEPEIIVEVKAQAEVEVEADAQAVGTAGDEEDFPADIIAARLAGVAIAADIAPEEIAEPVALVDDDRPGGSGWDAPDPQPAARPQPAIGRATAHGTWGETESAWAPAPATAVATAEAPFGVPAWTSGETTVAREAMVDAQAADEREAIMAALEADAEAVVVAETAMLAETASADETDGTTPTVGIDAGEPDSGATAELPASTDTAGFEAAFADRLASLLPDAAEGAPSTEPRTTQVVVSGLVSVASIASFKRHLGRLAGVTAVAVASGPEGEFVFNVTHRADASFRDGIPTMSGFAARVTNVADGVVQVTARDPETEG